MNQKEIRKKIKEAIQNNDIKLFAENISLLVYKKTLPDFAIDWLTKYPEIAKKEHKHLVVLAPRNHLKTMIFSVYLPLWRMIQNPLYEIMIFSYSVEQAKHFLDILRNIIEMYFPEWINKKNWSKSKIVLQNGASYMVGSMTSTRYGFHPNMIIVDDPLGGEGDPQKVIKTNLPPGFIEERFFSMILPMLSPTSELYVVGIPFYHGDLFTKLKERPDAFMVLSFPAIVNETQKKVLWPQERSYEWLMKQRQAIGYTRFAREYLLQPYDEKSSLIPITIIMPNIYYDIDLKRSRISQNSYCVVSADFAISSTIGADYTVFMALELLDDRIYILDYERFKESDYNKQLESLLYFINKYQPNKVIVEKNNFQRIYSQELNARLLNVEEYYTHSEKHLFNLGIPSLRLLFENKQVIIPYLSEEAKNKMDEFIKELQGFIMVDNKVLHIGKHDDIAMAFYLGIQGLRNANMLINKKTVKVLSEDIIINDDYFTNEADYWKSFL